MENPLKIREELMSAASPAARKQYIEGMRKYFIGLLSHKELAIIVRSALGPHTGIHNRFIRAIFTNAEHKALVEHYGPQYTKDRKPEPASRQPASTAGQKPPDGPPLQSTAPPTPVTPMKTMWSVKYPALGNGPPQIQTSLAGGITDLLLDEDSFVAMHNRMLQLCLPTAVDAVSPDAAIMLMHALGAYLKATVSCCPEASMPSGGGGALHGAHVPPPQPFLHAGAVADQELEWEAPETESELHDRVAREQVASATAKAQVRLQTRKRQGAPAANTSRVQPCFAVVPVQDGDLVACVAQRQEQRLKRKREQGQGQQPKGRRRLIEIRLDKKSDVQEGKGNEAQNSQGDATSSSAEPMKEDEDSSTKKGESDSGVDPADNDKDNVDKGGAKDAKDATNKVEIQDEDSNDVGKNKETLPDSRPGRAAEIGTVTEDGKGDATNAKKENDTKRKDGDTANGAKADGQQQIDGNGHSSHGLGVGIEPPLGFAGRATLRLPPPRPYPPAGKLGADLEAWSAREVLPANSMSGHSGAGNSSHNSNANSQADGKLDSSTAAASKPSAQQRGKKAAAAAAAAAAAQQQPFVPASAPVNTTCAETEAYKLYPHVTMSDLSLAFWKARVHRNAVYGAGAAVAGQMR